MNDILFGNNNKAVIKKLANRSFRSNKMRNVIAVIANALTTFLFTAVLTIGMGASGTLEYSMAKLMGSSADALVQGLSEEQFQQLKQNAMFEKVGCWIPIDIMTNTNRRVAEVDYADQNYSRSVHNGYNYCSPAHLIFRVPSPFLLHICRSGLTDSTPFWQIHLHR